MEYFVLGIGGTGMRCIESFIHLCAMGMLDNTTVHLLALDTDKDNGNFKRLKDVKDAYQNIKSLDSSNRVSGQDSFFTAKIEYYEFSPNYETKSTFKAVFDYDNTQSLDYKKSDLADLIFSKNVEEFNLRHGYRAQTHLGSMMMYHSIIEAAQSQRSNDLKRFIQNLITASNNGKPRVFILGSVFGGTGASSIPIIPQAIAKAAGIMSEGTDILQNTYFGSTLLTAYFSFNPPTATERKDQKIIATSDKFALNSQVAMMFYQDDTSVKQIYQKFYMIGTPGMNWKPMPQNEQSGAKTITGGSEQENDSHYIELLAASAVLDFMHVDESVLESNKKNTQADYQYRSVKDNGLIEFQDFVGQERAVEFAKKLNSLFIFSILCNNSEYDFVTSIQNGAAKIEGYEDVDPEQIKNLKNYFSLFYNFKKKTDGSLDGGWIRQLHRSAGGDDKLLFAAELFTPKNEKEQAKSEWNRPFRKEGVGSGYGFKTGLRKTKYNIIKETFLKVYDGTDGIEDKSKSFANRHEQLIKRIYDTLSAVYQY